MVPLSRVLPLTNIYLIFSLRVILRDKEFIS